MNKLKISTCVLYFGVLTCDVRKKACGQFHTIACECCDSNFRNAYRCTYQKVMVNTLALVSESIEKHYTVFASKE